MLCMHLCMYVCTFLRACFYSLTIYIYIYIYMYIHKHIQMYSCTVRTCTYRYTYTCVGSYNFVHNLMYLPLCTGLRLNLYNLAEESLSHFFPKDQLNHKVAAIHLFSLVYGRKTLYVPHTMSYYNPKQVYIHIICTQIIGVHI